MERLSPNPSDSVVAAGHEVRDASALPIVTFVVSLIATLVVVHFLAVWAMRVTTHKNEANNLEVFPVNSLAGRISQVPPDPRLEPEPSRDVLPRMDLTDVRVREGDLIGDGAWKWTDSSHRFARIPVQQAMELAERNGLPLVLPATQPDKGPFAPPASSLHGPGGVP